MITPFKEDDSVDYDALLRLVDYQLQNGTDFLCVLGTTAETPTLTKEEKDKIKRLIIERVNGRIPILLGVSSNCTRAVVETLMPCLLLYLIITNLLRKVFTNTIKRLLKQRIFLWFFIMCRDVLV